MGKRLVARQLAKEVESQPDFRKVVLNLFEEVFNLTTQKSIAAHLGVAESTLSGYLNHPESELPEEGIKRIREQFSLIGHHVEILSALARVKTTPVKELGLTRSVDGVIEEAHRLIQAQDIHSALEIAEAKLNASADQTDRFQMFHVIQSLYLKLGDLNEAIKSTEMWEHEANVGKDFYQQSTALLQRAAAMRLSGNYKAQVVNEIHSRLRICIDQLEDSHPRKGTLTLAQEGELIVWMLNQRKPIRNTAFLKELPIFIRKLDLLIDQKTLGHVEQGVHGMKARAYIALGDFPMAKASLHDGLNKSFHSLVDSLDSFRLVYVELLLAEGAIAEASKQATALSTSARLRGDQYVFRSAQALLARARQQNRL